jgi:hypothetical protein
MADADNDHMNSILRRGRAPKVILGADGRVEWVDDPLAEPPAEGQQEPAPSTRPTGSADQGVRGSTPPAERSMNDRIRGALRAVRTPVFDDDRPRGR